MMNPELMMKYQDIKKDVEKLNANLGEVSRMVGAEFKEYGGEALEEIKAKASQVADLGRQKGKEVHEFASENPIALAATLSAVGFVVGFLAGKSKSR